MLENQHDIGRLHERPMAVVTAAVLLLIVFATSSDDVLSDDDCSLFFFDDAGRGNMITQGIEEKRKYDHFKDMKQVLFVVDSIAQVKWLLSHRSNQTINEIIIKGQKEK
ncbi:hypothetical protein DERF_009233 [Dermatophagoides farinae]|uniref:Uncharacterized protein n=1 Tax=Dermatophagoides farinae TaxID=6954 RepID=A0A922HWV0_DERFA|nr:hypothetical protein DERF_009233 [Dermatophagoides farinae]